jgi:hypothetical protein
MTRDDIIGWMQEVGAKKSDPTPQNYDGFVDIFQRFAALVAEREKEACATVCDEVECGSSMMIEERQTANECARKIRARGQS